MKRLALYNMFLFLPLVILFDLPVNSWAAVYSIPISTTTIDGRSFCGGEPCKGGDVLIIKGGLRKGARFVNFDGNGSYITVTNENATPDNRVMMNQGPGAGKAIFSIDSCRWVDFRGDADPDIEYGILVNMGAVTRSANIHVYGYSDNIKLSYFEASFDGVPDGHYAESGIRVQDAQLEETWVYDTFEIHHNYVHDSPQTCMYVGHNEAIRDDHPTLKSFSIHDNIFKRPGTYGFALKGVIASDNYIYNNLVDTTGVLYPENGSTEHANDGFRVNQTYDGVRVYVYNNTVMHSKGPGIYLKDQRGDSFIELYDNKILGCGTGPGERTYFENGFDALYGGRGSFNDNIVIQSGQYGIFFSSSAYALSASRNLIGDMLKGAVYDEKGELVEGVGEDANIYHDDVADFGFDVWSDDGNYYNDEFTFDGKSKISTPLGFKVVELR